MQKRSQKSWSNYWTGHSQEILIHQWNLAKTGLNKNDGYENPLISYVYNNNFKLNSNKSDILLQKSKQALRNLLSKRRSNLSRKYVINSSSLISKYFLHSHAYLSSENIALYYPFKNEVNPLAIIEHSVNLGKNILLPKIEGDMLSFRTVHNLEELILNKYGIYEPKPGSKKTEIDDIDLFVIPGLAFDISGNRIGFGKGFYDRTLESVTSSKIIGFCYFFQIFNELPANELDKKAGFLVSEDGFLSCKS